MNQEKNKKSARAHSASAMSTPGGQRFRLQSDDLIARVMLSRADTTQRADTDATFAQ